MKPAKRPSRWRDPTARYAGPDVLGRALLELSPDEREILLSFIAGVPRQRVQREARTGEGLDRVLARIRERLRTLPYAQDLWEELAQDHAPRFSPVMRELAAVMGLSDRVPRCAHGPCSALLLQPASTGRPRQYCSDKCRQAAYRLRKQQGVAAQPEPASPRRRFPLRDLFAELTPPGHWVMYEYSDLDSRSSHLFADKVLETWGRSRYSKPHYPPWLGINHGAVDFRSPGVYPSKPTPLPPSELAQLEQLGRTLDTSRRDRVTRILTGVPPVPPPAGAPSWARCLVESDEPVPLVVALGSPLLGRRGVSKLMRLASPLQQWLPSHPRIHYWPDTADVDMELSASQIVTAEQRGLSSEWWDFGYRRLVVRRPSNVMSKAFRAAFQRMAQRRCPLPVGSRLITAR